MAQLTELVVKIAADIGNLQRNMSAAQRSVNSFGEKMKDAGRSISVGVTLPLVAMGAAAVSAAAEMDSLTRGLTAVSGSAQATQQQLARLQDIAKLPGLGFREAIQGSIALQAAGLSAGLAERSLRAFGNALATVGRGKDDLNGVVLALQQISAKGKITAEDINQIAERVPQVRKAMQDAFGTADTEKLGRSSLTATEFISRLAAELEKLPKVTGGAANSFENLSDAWFRARVTIGQQLLPAVIPLVEGLADMVTQIRQLDPQTVRWGIAIGAVAAVVGPLVLTVGSLTTAMATLSAAVGVGLLPLIAVGGPLALALGGLSALLIKNKLDALNAAGALAQYRAELTTLSGLELAKQRRDLEDQRSVLAGRSRRSSFGQGGFWGNFTLQQTLGRFFGNPEAAEQLRDVEARLHAVRLEQTALSRIQPTPVIVTPHPDLPNINATGDAIHRLAAEYAKLKEEIKGAVDARKAFIYATPNLAAPRLSPVSLSVRDPEAPIKSLVDSAKSALGEVKDASDKAGPSAHLVAGQLSDLANALGGLSPKLRNAIIGVSSLFDGIGKLGSARGFLGQFTAAAGVFGGMVSVLEGINGLFKRSAELLLANIDALDRLRFQATGFDPNSPTNLQKALQAVLALQGIGNAGNVTGPGGLQVHGPEFFNLVNQAIAAAGLDQAQLIGVLEALGLPHVRDDAGRLDTNVLGQFEQALRDAITGTSKLAQSATAAANAMINVAAGFRLQGAIWRVQDPRPWTPPAPTGPATPDPAPGGGTVNLTMDLQAGAAAAPDARATYRALWNEWRQQTRTNPAMLAWFNTLAVPA